jgi:hypothetical protein
VRLTTLLSLLQANRPQLLVPDSNIFAGGPPVLGKYNAFDPPDDFFRIRLISIMLETCGMFFNRGAAGKKLDYFLSFFQVSQVKSIGMCCNRV